MDEVMNVGFACSGHTDDACVYFCDANSLLLSPTPKPSQREAPSGVACMLEPQCCFKGHQVPPVEEMPRQD